MSHKERHEPEETVPQTCILSAAVGDECNCTPHRSGSHTAGGTPQAEAAVGCTPVDEIVYMEGERNRVERKCTQVVEAHRVVDMDNSTVEVGMVVWKTAVLHSGLSTWKLVAVEVTVFLGAAVFLEAAACRMEAYHMEACSTGMGIARKRWQHMGMQ